jgi:hypothetical protein
MINLFWEAVCWLVDLKGDWLHSSDRQIALLKFQWRQDTCVELHSSTEEGTLSASGVPTPSSWQQGLNWRSNDDQNDAMTIRLVDDFRYCAAHRFISLFLEE